MKAIARWSATRQRVAAVLLVLLAYGGITTLKLAHARGDFSVFVVAGDRFFDRSALDVPITVLPHSDGYDGQFVYRLALDPLTSKKTDHGISIDTPSLRGQRIGLPLLAHLVSFGSPRLVPAALVLVNLAAVALLTWLATGLAIVFGRPGWHGLVISFYPGLLLSLSRDTTEIVSTTLALGAVLLALRGRPWMAGLVASAAVLTRETTLLYLAGFGLVALVQAVTARRADPRVLAFLLPVVTWAGWQVILFRIWGATSFSEVGSHDFGWPPLRYLIDAIGGDVQRLQGPIRHFGMIYDPVSLMFVLAQLAIVVVALRHSRPLDWRLLLPWLGYLGMAMLFTDAVWVESFGYLRILVDLYVTGCLLLLASPVARAPRLLLMLAVPVWLVGWGYV